jgi:hypothetical protein
MIVRVTELEVLIYKGYTEDYPTGVLLLNNLASHFCITGFWTKRGGITFTSLALTCSCTYLEQRIVEIAYSPWVPSMSDSSTIRRINSFIPYYKDLPNIPAMDCYFYDNIRYKYGFAGKGVNST